MNISVKSQTVPKKSGKGLTNYFKTRKKPKFFVVFLFLCHEKKLKLYEYH